MDPASSLGAAFSAGPVEPSLLSEVSGTESGLTWVRLFLSMRGSEAQCPVSWFNHQLV